MTTTGSGIGRHHADAPPTPAADEAPVWDERVSAWLVGETPHHYVHICPMAYNHRVVLTPLDDLMGYDVGWCYSTDHDGKGYEIALDAVRRWLACGDAEPSGYTKAVGWTIPAHHPRRRQ